MKEIHRLLCFFLFAATRQFSKYNLHLRGAVTCPLLGKTSFICVLKHRNVRSCLSENMNRLFRKNGLD